MVARLWLYLGFIMPFLATPPAVCQTSMQTHEPLTAQRSHKS